MMDSTAPARPASPTAATRVAAVTVAICTHGRPDALRRALTSVITQQPAPAQILVIDNAPPNDATELLVRSEFPQVTYHLESVQGLDFARNRALEEATEEIVSFIDDDVVLEPGALARLTKVFVEFPRAGACTGRVFALTLDTEGQRLFEGNGGFGRGAKRIRLPADARRPLYGLPAPRIAWALSVGSGSCLAVRRSAALALRGFDEALDLGAALPGGGDHDMLWRVLQSGLEVVYEPMVRAKHEHRTSVDGALTQIVGHQRALVALLIKTLSRARWIERGPIAVYLGWRLLKPGFRLVRRVAGRDPLPAAAILRMWGACWKGLFAYQKSVRIARTRREEAAR